MAGGRRTVAARFRMCSSCSRSSRMLGPLRQGIQALFGDYEGEIATSLFTLFQVA